MCGFLHFRILATLIKWGLLAGGTTLVLGKCTSTKLCRSGSRYEGLPGWRRMNIVSQILELLRLGLMFPVYCLAYMLCPNSSRGVFMKNPFVKFIAHSGTYCT